MKIYRHGDLSFHPIDKLPKGLKEVEHKGNFVLAEGEFTGHKHLMTVEKPKEMKMMQDPKTGEYYIQLFDKAELTHEEHKKLVFEPGIYKMHVEREFDYFAKETEKQVREVID